MPNNTPRRWTGVLWALLCGLMLASLALRLEPAGESVRLPPAAAIWALALGMLLVLANAWRHLDRPFVGIPLWLLAALFAGIMTLAESFSDLGTAELLTQSLEMKLKALLYFVGRIPFYFMAMRLLQSALQRDALRPATQVASWPSPLALHLQKPYGVLSAAGLMLLCWLPYFLCLFPGTVSNDSITQLKEIYGVLPLSAGNPLFQTFLLGAFCALGDLFACADVAVAAYCIFQALLMALLFAYVLRAMAKARTPRWLLRAALLFFALCPIFPLFAFCIGKDTNFSMAILFFSLMAWQVLMPPQGQKSALGVTLGLCLATALLVLLRNPGVYMAAISLLFLLLGCLRPEKDPPPASRRPSSRRWLPPVAALAVMAVTWSVLQLWATPAVGALPMPETEHLSVPLQQVARVVASQPETLTEEEKTALSGVLPLQALKAAYNGELSDPVKALWNQAASPAQKAAFFKAWLSLAARHPSTSFSALFHNSYGYLCPGALCTPLKPTLLIGPQGRVDGLEGAFPFTVNPLAQPLQAFFQRLMAQPLFRLLIAPGLYGWLALFAGVTTLMGQHKRLFLLVLPATLVLLGNLLSAVNGYFRYALPMYFCAPLLLAFCAMALWPPPQKGENAS